MLHIMSIADKEIWVETEGAIDWLREFADSRKLVPPHCTHGSLMYCTMFNTAVEMIAACSDN